QMATSVSAQVGDDLDPSVAEIEAELKPGIDPEKAEAAVWDELKRLRQEPVGPEELRKAQNQVEAAFVMGQKSTEALALRLGDAEALTGVDYLKSYLDRIRQVSPAELQRVVALYLTPDRATVGAVTPREGVREGGREGARERGSERVRERTRTWIRGGV